jgi:hypothetical protein
MNKLFQKTQVRFEGNLLRKSQKTIKKDSYSQFIFPPLKLNLTYLDALPYFNGQATTTGPLPIRVIAGLGNWAAV